MGSISMRCISPKGAFKHALTGLSKIKTDKLKSDFNGNWVRLELEHHPDWALLNYSSQLIVQSLCNYNTESTALLLLTTLIQSIGGQIEKKENICSSLVSLKCIRIENKDKKAFLFAIEQQENSELSI